MQITKSFECSYFFSFISIFHSIQKHHHLIKRNKKKQKKIRTSSPIFIFAFFSLPFFFIFVSLLSDKMVEFFGFHSERERERQNNTLGNRFFSLSFSLVIRIRGGFSYEQKKLEIIIIIDDDGGDEHDENILHSKKKKLPPPPPQHTRT